MLRVGSLAPDHLYVALAWQDALKEDIRRPVTCDKHGRVSCLLFLAFDFVADFSLQFCDVLVFSKPAASMEINDGLLLAASLVNLHCLSNVDVGRA